MISTTKRFLLTLSLLLSVVGLRAMDGTLDGTFGSGGTVTLGDAQVVGGRVSIQSSNNTYGGAWVLGPIFEKFNGVLARLNPTGGEIAPQVTDLFGDGSRGVGGMALRGNDNIVYAGYDEDGNFAIAQITTAGALDTSFGSGTGKITIPGIVNQFDLFGDNGQMEALTGVAIQPDGKVVIAGSGAGNTRLIVARVLADGSALDASFGTAGVARFTIGANTGAMALALQPDGKILVGGATDEAVILARVLADGSALDTAAFGAPSGFVTLPTGEATVIHSVVLLPNDQILTAAIGGTNPDFSGLYSISRFNTDGSLDAAGYGSGTGTIDLSAQLGVALPTFQPWGGEMIVQPDGKAIGVQEGNFPWRVARVLADGSGLDTSWGGTGVVETGSLVSSEGVALAPDGKVVAIGYGGDDFFTAFARYENSVVFDSSIINVPLNGDTVAQDQFFLGTAQPLSIVDIVFDGTLIVASGWTDDMGNFNIIPTSDLPVGTSQVTAVARYKQGNVNIASQAIELTVEEVTAPVTQDAAFSTFKNTPITPASNPPGDLNPFVSGGVPPYTFNLESMPANGTVVLNPDGTFTYTPDLDFVSPPTDTFTYSVTDDEDQTSNISTVTITVEEFSVNVCENASVSGTLPPGGGTGPWTFSLLIDGTIGNVTGLPNMTGDFTYTSTGGAGADSFTYQTVSSDEIPVITDIEVPVTVNEGPTVGELGIEICASDEAEANLPISGGTPPYDVEVTTDPTKGDLVLTNNPGDPVSFTYTPFEGESGSDSFGYTATDANECSADGRVTIDILEAPTVAARDLGTDCPGTVKSSPPLDPLTASGGTAPYVFEQVGEAVGGTAVVNGDGTFTFTPTAGFQGQASFQYQATDNGGQGCPSNVATVSITYAAPTANDLPLGDVEQGESKNGQLPQPTGGTAPFVFSNPTTPAKGTVTGFTAGGSFTYNANADASGADSFDYTVTDANGCTDTGTVTVNIVVTAGPEVKDLDFQNCQNAILKGSLTAGLIPETGTPPFTYSAVAGSAQGGSVKVQSNGSFTWTPEIGNKGPGSFMYRVTDSNDLSATATVTIEYTQQTDSALLNEYDRLYRNLCVNGSN